MDKQTAAKCAKLSEPELAQALVAGDKFSDVAQAYHSAMSAETVGGKPGPILFMNHQKSKPEASWW